MKPEHERPGWHSRGYLPHFDGGALPQFITFRLAHSVPGALLERWRDETAHLPPQEAAIVVRQRVEVYLDGSEAPASWLREPTVARLVEESLLYFDGVRYHVHAWVVMPNHVHVLMTPAAGWTLSTIIQSWKSYAARMANRLLTREGSFWYPDYFDRAIRDERHLAMVARYIEGNPVKAGLCTVAEEWPFGSAQRREDTTRERGHQVHELRGVGHAQWDGSDAQEQVNRERDAWDG